MNQTERLIFLAHIRDHPRDFSSRKIFADWLDEHDEPEEADKQRGWNDEKQDAWEWLEKCALGCSRYTPFHQEDGESHSTGDEVSIEELITAALRYLDTGEPCPLPMNSDSIGADGAMFWKNIELVTGRKYTLPPPPDEDIYYGQGDGMFRCAC